MRYFLFLLAYVLSFKIIIAQVQLSRTSFELEEISLLKADIIDFNIANTTSEDIQILRIDAEKEVGIQYTSKTIRAGGVESIRIKLNPSKRGKINRRVGLFLSNNKQPVELNIFGRVKAIPKNNGQACPQFGSDLKPPQPSKKKQPIARIQQFELALYDEDSGEQYATIEAIPQNKTSQLTYLANSKPITKDSSTAQKSKDKQQRKTPEERRNSPSLGQILFGKAKDSASISSTSSIEKRVAITHIKDTALSKVSSIDKERSVLEEKTASQQAKKLLDTQFKPNNIVFLIDASNSMKEDNRMSILKTAMIELLESLRAIDFLTIVTYSGEATIVLPPTSGNNKEEIAQQINMLIADGSTNGAKGIKKAIQTGLLSFIEGGNNQIFLATDGAFDIGSKNIELREEIKETAEKGLTITALGIKNESWTNASLKEIVQLGGGTLIRIKTDRGASKVLNEVKRKAKKINQ